MVTSQVHLSELQAGRCRETVQMRLIRSGRPSIGSLRSIDLSAFDVARSKPKLRFGDAPVTIRFQSCSHYVLSQCFGNLIMNFQTFCEVIEDDNSSAQSTEFLLARQSKFVWMGGVVNSTRSNRFANGLYHSCCCSFFFFYSFCDQEPWGCLCMLKCVRRHSLQISYKISSLWLKS
uniref:Uncharacterized protein n=1 Tax=Brassica oleracea TaxID=3712 RepID=A0A3P6DGE8_BRAOL|nr:unnamed protein product [Brassica oleracea]